MNTELVKQAKAMLNKVGANVTLEEAYHELLKQNFINVDGTPTKWALDNGLIKKAYRYDFPNGLQKPKTKQQEDNDMHEVFSRLPKSSVIQDKEDDDYLIKSHDLIKAIKEALANNNLSPTGRKKWHNVLTDLESSVKNEK